MDPQQVAALLEHFRQENEARADANAIETANLVQGFQNTMGQLFTHLQAAQAAQHPPANIHSRFKVPDPALFSLRREDARSFIAQIRISLEAQSCTDQAKMCLYLGTRLTGSPLEWFIRQQEIDATNLQTPNYTPLLSDFNTLTTTFTSLFGDHDPVASADRKLQALKMDGRSCADYVTEFRATSSLLTLDAYTLRRRFYDGLAEGLKDRIAGLPSKPADVEDLITASLSLDERWRERQTEKKNRPTPNMATTTNRFQHPSTTSPRFPHHTPMEVDGTTTHTVPTFRKLTPEDRLYCAAQGLCFRCRQAGHDARDCTVFTNRAPAAGATSRRTQANTSTSAPRYNVSAAVTAAIEELTEKGGPQL